MKQTLILLFTICWMSNAIFAAEIDMVSTVQRVTIYHSGALVERMATTDLKPGMNELVFRNISSKLVLNSLKSSNKEVTILNKTLIRKLTAEEFSQLLDQKDALAKQMTLIEAKYNETGFVVSVEDLEKMTAFYTQKMVQIKKDLRAIERRIEEAKKLEDIQLENENAAILKLIVSIEGKLSLPFSIQYVCGGIGWSPAYEVNVESSASGTIEVKYLAKAMSQTGENWDQVTVNLSSSFPLESPTNLPSPVSPWVLKNGNVNSPYQQANSDERVNSEWQQIDQLEGVEYLEISIPSNLKLRTLREKYSIKSNSTVFTFPIQTVDLPASYFYYGYPSLDAEVYLVAEVTGWDTLGFVDGIANITYAGNNIGKSVLKFSESKDTLLLPVGKDNSVYMTRTEIADEKYFETSTIGKRQKTTLAYKFELKNNNAFPIRFELADQLPISQSKSAEVDLDKSSNGRVNEEEGEITWIMELRPGQAESKELVYTIETEANFRFKSRQSSARYRTISCPSF